jgi:hypothetical protein
MVNTTPKGADEWTPKVNRERRRFLLQLVATTSVAVWAWIWWDSVNNKREKDSKIRKKREIESIQPVIETRDFDENIENTIENLMDLYENLELMVAREFYMNNKSWQELYFLNVIGTTLHDLTLDEENMYWNKPKPPNIVKVNDWIKQRMNNMIFQIENKFTGWAIIAEWLTKKYELFAKKYPQLAPVIEEWKKKNWK